MSELKLRPPRAAAPSLGLENVMARRNEARTAWQGADFRTDAQKPFRANVRQRA